MVGWLGACSAFSIVTGLLVGGKEGGWGAWCWVWLGVCGGLLGGKEGEGEPAGGYGWGCVGTCCCRWPGEGFNLPAIFALKPWLAT